MSGWDQLRAPARWPCGHAKTPENTQTGHRQSDRCKECHRRKSREYYERLRKGSGEDAAEEALPRGAQGLRQSCIDEGALAADRERAAKLGGEFVAALHRWTVNESRRSRLRRAPQ